MLKQNEKINYHMNKFKDKLKNFSNKFSHFLKNEVFSKEYFIFAFNLIFRKWALYCSLVVYLLMVIAFVFVGPLISAYQPSYFLTTPLTSLILILVIAIISSFIAIEIFRTPIDDGTELLTISKPLHRSQIFFMKCLITGIIGFSMSALGSFVSLSSLFLSFLNKDEFLFLIFGIFFGTFLTFWFFACFSVFCSLFGKKILVLLVSSGLAFLLVVTSLLSSLIIDKSNDSSSTSRMDAVSSISISNIDKKGEASLMQGFMYNGSELKAPTTPEEAYNADFNKSFFPKISLVNFATQLSSMLLLTHFPDDLLLTYKTYDVSSMPAKLKFDSVYDWSKYSGSSINITDDDINKIFEGTQTTDVSFPDLKFLYVPTYYTTLQKEGNLLSRLYYFYTDYINIKALSPTNSDLTTFDDSLWNEFKTAMNSSDSNNDQNNTESSSLGAIAKTAISFFNKIDIAASQVVENYFVNVLTSNLGIQSVMKILNNYIYSGMVKHLINGDINVNSLLTKIFTYIKNSSSSTFNWTDESNREDVMQLIYLRLLGVNISKGISNIQWLVNNSGSGNTNSITGDQIYESLTDIFGNKISFTTSSVEYTFNPFYFLFPSVIFEYKNFQVAKYVGLYNPYALFVCWAIFSTFITLISLTIYRKKDFK